MQADQRKSRQPVIKFHFVIPCFFVVAARAILSLFAPVDVILRMTGNTTGSWLLCRDPRCVARSTFHPFMRTLERKTRLRIVVKGGLLPAARRVASCTRRTVGTLVCIICPVTGNAAHVHALRASGTLVTGGASKICMPTGERKPRLPVVVEAYLLP